MSNDGAPHWIIRTGTNADSEALVALVDGVYREYGDEIYLEGYDSDLLDIEGSYRACGGEFVVLEVDGKVVGAHATQPIDGEAGLLTFRRLYLPAELRGTGAGFCFNVGRLGTAAAFLTFGFWLRMAAEDQALILSPLYLAGAIVVLFGRETRGTELPE